MTLISFIKKADFANLNEIEKVESLAFYNQKINNITEWDLPTIAGILTSNGFGKPNSSRLKLKLTQSKSFVKGTKSNHFRLHSAALKKLEDTYPFLNEISDHIETVNTVLPEDLYSNTRGYIVKLAIQINASYENNICDGCAVLMRRLLEILLILSYSAKKREDEIKDSLSGGYKNLSTIIDYSLSNKIPAIQKDTREVLHDFRELGNFSAHGITYNCRKEELTKVARKYRLAIEDLLYAAELKK